MVYVYFASAADLGRDMELQKSNRRHVAISDVDISFSRTASYDVRTSGWKSV